MNDVSVSAAPIRFENLWHVYGIRRPKIAVRNFNLEVNFGEVVALLGTNGAGKTTVIKSLLGQLTPSSGRAVLLGHEASTLPPELRRRVGYMAEGNKLDPWATVGQMIGFTRSFYPTWNAGECDRLTTHLCLDPKQRIKGLSNGERGRLALVLALAPDPDVLVLDDPMLGIDPVVRHEFFETMADVLSRQDGKKRAILFTSHVLPDVERVADRVVIMVGGSVVAQGPIASLHAAVRRVRVQLSGEANAPFPVGLPGVISTRRDGRSWRVVTTDVDALRELSPASIDEDEMTFEELFVVLAAPARTSGVLPLYQSGKP